MACPYCNPPTAFPFFQQPANTPRVKKPSMKKMVKELKEQIAAWEEILKVEDKSKEDKKNAPKKFNLSFTPLAIMALTAAPFVGIGSSMWFLHTFKEVIPLLIK